MNKFQIAMSVVAGLAVAALLAFLFSGDDEPEAAPVAVVQTPQPRVVPAPVQEIQPPPQPQLPATEPELPPVQNVETPAEPAPPPLPDLNNSDPYVEEQIAALPAGPAMLGLLADQELVRKFVTATENISRGFYPTQNLPFLMLSRQIVVQPNGPDRYVMSPATYERYTPLVNAIEALDTRQSVRVYRNLQPLVSRAFFELGLPNRNFDDVLLAAIDNILNAPMIDGPFDLVRPSVNYQFADPAIENLQEVEKLLLRMGPTNAGRVQAKLRQVRQELQATRP